MDTLYVNGYRLLQVSCDIHDLYTLGFDDNIDMTAHVRNSPAGIAGTISLDRSCIFRCIDNFDKARFIISDGKCIIIY